MTEQEFDVIDELYFPVHFELLLQKTQLSAPILLQTLKSLHEKGWLRCLDAKIDIEIRQPNWETDYQHYRYNASKKGLLAHNGFE